MSKKLTPLEALEKLMNGCCATCFTEFCGTKRNGACANFQNYKIIQTALKRIDELEKKCEMEQTMRIRFETIAREKTENLRVIQEKVEKLGSAIDDITQAFLKDFDLLNGTGEEE